MPEFEKDRPFPERTTMAEASMNREIPDTTSTTTQPSRRFRFDKGDRGKAEGGNVRASLLGDFGLFDRKEEPRPRIAVLERRSTERIHNLECKSWVGWKKFRGFSMNHSLLVDISRGGARIFIDKAPPPHQPVWIYLETPFKHASVRARVVVAEQTKQGQCMLRVEFEEHCPYDFFEAAVCGVAAANPKTRTAGNELRKAKEESPELVN